MNERAITQDEFELGRWAMTKSQSDTVKMIGQLLALVVLISGIAFAAGNYPTRGEWQESRTKQLVEIEQLRTKQSQLQLEQVRLGASMKAIERSQDRNEKTQTEINRKLDSALERIPARTRR